MCDVGYFYLDKKCTPQFDSGDKCNNDYMCQTNEGCNKGQCIPYYSLKIWEETENSKYCESGISERIGDKILFVEIELTTEEYPEYKVCEYNVNTGNGEKGILTHYPCKCTLIDSEKSVCVKGFEMGYRKKAASLSKQFYKSMKGEHTMKRDGEPDDFDLKKQIEIN